MSRGLFNSVFCLYKDLELRRPGLQVPFSCRFHRRVMTSVVVERPISLHVFVICFDRLGRCSLSLFWLARSTWRVQLDSFIGFLSGLACRPTDSFIVLVFGFVSRETPILAGGIGVARAVVGAFLLFVFGFGTIMSQCC